MYVIGVACAACGSCESQCPAGAISYQEELERCVIDQALCVGCGTCLHACLMGAITEE